MFCSVITLSATICAYFSVTSDCRLISSPCRHGHHLLGWIGSKIIETPIQLTVQPMITPPIGRTYQCGKTCRTPNSAKPIGKPK